MYFTPTRGKRQAWQAFSRAELCGELPLSHIGTIWHYIGTIFNQLHEIDRKGTIDGRKLQETQRGENDGRTVFEIPDKIYFINEKRACPSF